MTERIDHATEARREMERAREMESAKAASMYAALAQAEATLALAEQQRIANLIAYCTAADTLHDGHKEWIEQEWGISND